jgi:gas vesicle protein
MPRLSVERETAILDVVSATSPEEAAALRDHLREMRSDQWARELVERVVEAMVEMRHAVADMRGSLDTSADRSAEVWKSVGDRLDTALSAFEELAKAEALREKAEAETQAALKRRAETQNDGLREAGKTLVTLVKSQPAMMLYGGIVLLFLQRLGMAAEWLPMLFGGSP